MLFDDGCSLPVITWPSATIPHSVLEQRWMFSGDNWAVLRRRHSGSGRVWWVVNHTFLSQTQLLPGWIYSAPPLLGLPTVKKRRQPSWQTGEEQMQCPVAMGELYSPLNAAKQQLWSSLPPRVPLGHLTHWASFWLQYKKMGGLLIRIILY